MNLRDVIWATPDGAFPATADPAGPRRLVGANQAFPYSLAEGVRVTAPLDTLVEVTIDDGIVTALTPR